MPQHLSRFECVVSRVWIHKIVQLGSRWSSRAATPPGVSRQGLLQGRQNSLCLLLAGEPPSLQSHARRVCSQDPAKGAQGRAAGGQLSRDAQQGCSAHEIPSLESWEVEGMEQTRSGAASLLQQQDQECCSVALQLEGRIRQACLNSSLHMALSTQHDRKLPSVPCQPRAPGITAAFLSTALTHTLWRGRQGNNHRHLLFVKCLKKFRTFS